MALEALGLLCVRRCVSLLFPYTDYPYVQYERSYVPPVATLAIHYARCDGVLAGELEKNFHWGPNPLSAALITLIRRYWIFVPFVIPGFLC